ncbi:MAG: dihydrodipicolinate synthase family protein [Bacteroidales bacterium]|nr:dihydrodipicolinate synthase family protein [Bacteroidales bacterium]
MINKKTEGLIAAPFVPMHENGEINYEQIPRYYNILKRNGIVGIFINGSSGEGASLTQKEKMKIVKAWVEQKTDSDDMKIINLVGGTSYAESVENAFLSAEIGVDAIAVVAPYYFVPDSARSLADFCAKIALEVVHMPVYFYHIPVLTGCSVPMIEFLREASAIIPNLAGIKYTHEDFMDFLRCLNFEGGKYDMLWGRDETLLSALAVGAKAGVGSTFNYAAPMYYKLIEAYKKGNMDEARELQQLSVDMIALLNKYGGISVGKAYMRYIGFDCGEFRLPVKNGWTSVYKDFEKDVRMLNMEKLFSKT